MLIADAHLDLAWNSTRGRDVTRPAAEQPFLDNETATVGLPDLVRGSVGLICATIFCMPNKPAAPAPGGYDDHAGALAQARAQLAVYDDLFARRKLRRVTTAADLPAAAGDPPAAVLLMEGADAMTLAAESADADAAAWFAAGVRMVGLAWGRTRYSGGTNEPGPLTADGRRLVAKLDAAGMIHDASHLAFESLDEVLDLAAGPICASHSNAVAVIGENLKQRHFEDRHIRAVIARGGVIGTVLYDRFLLPPAELEKRRATLADVVRHVDHVCQLAGDCEHVGLGSDLDGGFGRERVPVELQTAADLPRLADALSAAGYADADVAKVMGGNWLNFFRRSLPGASVTVATSGPA